MKNIGIEILPTAQEALNRDMSNSVAVVIDVLRATTVITTALHNGAQCVVPVQTPQEAFDLRKQMGAEHTILGGERNADRIEGFDLGNSPQDYTPEQVNGKCVVITTTNGTVALHNCRNARRVLVASMLNMEATACEALQFAQKSNCNICIVAAGNYGLYTIEDCLCAASIAQSIESQCKVNYLSDFAIGVRMMAETNRNKWARQGIHYQRLVAKGYGSDIAACLEADNTMPIVIEADSNGRLTRH